MVELYWLPKIEQWRERLRGLCEAGDGAWDEAVAREVSLTAGLNGLVHDFKVPGGAENYGGVLRRRAALAGTVTVRTTPADPPWPASRCCHWPRHPHRRRRRPPRHRRRPPPVS